MLLNVFILSTSTIQIDRLFQISVITSAEEGGYVLVQSVCLSVRLSVRRITRKLVNGF